MQFPILNRLSDLMYLQPLSFYSNYKQKVENSKKAQNLKNGEFYEKNAQNKKDVEFDFASDKPYLVNKQQYLMIRTTPRVPIFRRPFWSREQFLPKKHLVNY